MSPQHPDLNLIRMLSERLERISADSIWAHRASGLRRSLLQILDDREGGHLSDQNIDAIIALAFRILESAAKRR